MMDLTEEIISACCKAVHESQLQTHPDKTNTQVCYIDIDEPESAPVDTPFFLLLLSQIFAQKESPTLITYQGTSIDLTPPFRRASMADLVKEACGIDFLAMESLDEAKEKAVEVLSGAKKDTTRLPGCPTIGHVLNEVQPVTSETN